MRLLLVFSTAVLSLNLRNRATPTTDPVPAPAPAPAPAPGVAPATEADSSEATPSTDAPPATAPTPTPEPKKEDVSVPQPISNDEYIRIDDGFGLCGQNPAGWNCLDSQAKMVLRIGDNLKVMENDFERIGKELTSIEQGKSVVSEDLRILNDAIYGSSPSDSKSLLYRVQMVRNAIKAMQKTIETQTAKTDAVVQNVTVLIQPELEDVKQVMNAQIAEIRNETNAILNKQFNDQNKKIEIVAQGIVREKDKLVEQVSKNAEIVKDSTKVVGQNTAAMGEAANAINKGLNAGLDDAEDEIASLNAYARSELGALNTKLSAEITDSFTDSKKQGVDALLEASKTAQGQLNNTYDSLKTKLGEEALNLAAVTSELDLNIQGSVATATRTLQEQEKKAGEKVNAFNETAVQYGAQLGDMQKSVASQFNGLASKAGERALAVSDLVAAFSQETSGQLSSTQAALRAYLGDLNKNAAGSLASFGGSVGDQLNALVAGLDKVQQDGDSALKGADEATKRLIAEAMLASGSSAFARSKAVEDALAAIGASADASQGLIDNRSKQVAGQYQNLRETLLSAMEDGAAAANEIGVTGQQRLVQLQQELQKLILEEDDKIGLKIKDAQKRQGDAVVDLKKIVATNIGKTGKDLTQVQTILQALVNAAGQAEAGKSSVTSRFNDAKSLTSKQVEDLKLLITSSQSAAGTAKTDAEARIQTAISRTGDNLKAGIESYASQFNELLRGRLGNINSATEGAATEISERAQSERQSSTAVKTKLDSIQGLLGATSFESEYASFDEYLKSLSAAKKAELDATMGDFRSQSETVLDRLRNDMLTASQTQTSAMSNQTAGTTAAVSGRVNGLLDMLSKQQELVAKLEADAMNLRTNYSNQYGTLSERIMTQRGRVVAAATAEMNEVNAVNDRVDLWRGELDANITNATNELNALLAKMPNITNSKVSISESAMVGQRDNIMAYVQDLKTKFDAQRAAQSSYLQQQSILRLAAILGVDRAAVEAKVGLMSKVDIQGLDQAEIARRSANILNSIADAIQAENDPAMINKIRNEIGNLTSSTGVLGKHFATYMGKEFSDLTIDQHKQQANFAKFIQEQALKTGSLSEAIAAELAHAVKALQDKEIMTSIALAEDRKGIFGLGTSLAGLSDDSRLKLIKLLHSVRREVEQARRTNEFLKKEGFEKIATVSGVMTELSDVIDDYVGESRHSFKDVNRDLEVFGTDIEDKLKTAESHLLTLARDAANSTSMTRGSQTKVISRVRNFIAQATKQYKDLVEEKGAMEVRASSEIEELQTQAQLTLNRVMQQHESVKAEIRKWLQSEQSRLSDMSLDDAPSDASTTDSIFGRDSQ